MWCDSFFDRQNTLLVHRFASVRTVNQLTIPLLSLHYIGILQQLGISLFTCKSDYVILVSKLITNILLELIESDLTTSILSYHHKYLRPEVSN